MGNFVQYMYTFVNQYNDANGTMSRKKISEWFANKKAVKRYGYPDEYVLDKKSAVVVVGVSCIGKSTYVQKFLANHPNFAAISYDDACYQKIDEIKAGAKDTATRMPEIVEERVLKVKDKNIIIDAVCIHPAARAALMRFLADLGYEIHLIFFTQAYTEANIKKCIENRAIKQTLYYDYLGRVDPSKMLMKEIIPVRDNILEFYSKERGISVESLKKQTENLPLTISNIIYLTQFYENEVEENRVWWQEKRELFMMGADYYYAV